MARMRHVLPSGRSRLPARGAEGDGAVAALRRAGRRGEARGWAARALQLSLSSTTVFVRISTVCTEYQCAVVQRLPLTILNVI